MDKKIHTRDRKNGKTACGLSTHGRNLDSRPEEVTCAKCHAETVRKLAINKLSVSDAYKSALEKVFK